jgi:hypothetical protein
LASIVEVMAAMAGVAVAIGVPVAVILAICDRNESVEKALDRWASQSKRDRTNRPARRRSIRPQAIGAGLVSAVQRRNRPTHAQKLMGIRRVDAGSGGEVTVSSAIVHYLVSESISFPATVVTNATIDRRLERLKALAPELRQLNRQHGDDWAGLLLEVFKLGRKHKADPFTPLALGIGARIAAHLACIVALPQRQSLPDLLSGIATTTAVKP